MLYNNLKISFRNLFHHRTQSAILIGGLMGGMIACLLILQYVSFELSYDDFHSKQQQIYRVVNERFQNGEAVQKGTITYPIVGKAMLEEFPEIINATRIAYSSDVMITQEQEVEPVEPGLWVDEHFFEIFDFKLLASDGLRVLDETNELVLTQSLADRYFPGAKQDYEKVIGQTLQIDRDPDIYKVVGVCEDVPANSLLQFELLGSYASCIRYWGEGADNSWTWSDFYHYLELEEGTDVAALEAKFTDFSERHFEGTAISGSKEIFTLQPLSEAHLYSADLEYEIGETGNGQAVWSLLIIAFFILLIAWINYVNLSSVRAIERAKEVGVRKVLGATKGQLIRQFLMDAAMINTLAFMLALGVVQMFSPWFSSQLGLNHFGFATFWSNTFNTTFLMVLMGVIVLGIIVSGAYPAWLLSTPQVSNILKNKFFKNIGGAGLRKGLVIFQFTISIALITVTWMVSRQIDFMSQRDLGIEIDQILTVSSPEMTGFDSTFIDKMNAFKAELKKYPTISEAATSSRVPGERMGRVFNIKVVGEQASDQNFTSNFIPVDYDYAATYGLNLLSGRFFRASDHSLYFDQLDKLIINETAVKMFGFSTPELALNQQLDIRGKKWTIIGVVPNFHQQSLHHPIEPIIFTPFYGDSHAISIKIAPQNIDETIQQIKSIYAQFFPGNAFDYTFLDTRFQQLYKADSRFRDVLSFFTFFAIFIACLGLFGLASYMTFLRTKEIGVRKVLGASTTSIVALLSKDFLKLVVIALVLAAPIAYIVTGKWLEGFAYQTKIAWWMFLLAGLVAVLIAFFTVGFKSVKAALANPINSLRNE